jgi:hypothetical protein
MPASGKADVKIEEHNVRCSSSVLITILVTMRANPLRVAWAVQGDPNLGVAKNTPDDK